MHRVWFCSAACLCSGQQSRKVACKQLWPKVGALAAPESSSLSDPPSTSDTSLGSRCARPSASMVTRAERQADVGVRAVRKASTPSSGLCTARPGALHRISPRKLLPCVLRPPGLPPALPTAGSSSAAAGTPGVGEPAVPPPPPAAAARGAALAGAGSNARLGRPTMATSSVRRLQRRRDVAKLQGGGEAAAGTSPAGWLAGEPSSPSTKADTNCSDAHLMGCSGRLAAQKPRPGRQGRRAAAWAQLRCVAARIARWWFIAVRVVQGEGTRGG